MVTVRVIWFWNAIKSFVLAFFVAGAVIFPLTEPYYIPRAVALGFIAYGIESVITFGRVTTSGWLSGNSSIHDVRVYGFLLWALLFAYLTYRDRKTASDD